MYEVPLGIGGKLLDMSTRQGIKKKLFYCS